MYYYFSNGASYRIPYFRTIAALIFGVFLHILQVGIILKRVFNISVHIFFNIDDYHRVLKYILIGIYFSLFYFLISKILPRNFFLNKKMPDEDLRKYQFHFFYYLGFNILMFVLLISDQIVFKK